MNSKLSLLRESLNKVPIGETNNFLWFITDIGIAAVFKDSKDNNDNNIIEEGLQISIDLSKEETEYCEINEKKIILFYS
tara:strand:- start:100 stop:336 length:237 start_codon:yes stop_codon:yes gene_type:complete